MAQELFSAEHERFLGRLRWFLGWSGALLLLMGLLRIGLELFNRDLAASLNATLFNTATLLLGGLYALVGYLLLYALAAVGALEPPALSALRNALLGLPAAGWATLLWGIFSGVLFGLVGLIWALSASILCFWLWQQIKRRNLWQVFGEKIARQTPNYWLLYLATAIGMAILITIGVIYAVLSNRLEIPLAKPDQGDLLYATTFDNFNDEWDFPRGRQSAEVRDGELVLTEGSGLSDAVFYARLDSRRFGDFELHVQTRQLGGDNDNSYGVIFRWRDFDNFYRFEISGDGYYRLSKTFEGQTENLTPWIPGAMVALGEAKNALVIIAEGNRFTFYINNQLARLCTKGEARQPTMNPLTEECISSAWQDHYVDDDFPQGKIGLVAGTTGTSDVTQAVVIGFDNVVITGP